MSRTRFGVNPHSIVAWSYSIVWPNGWVFVYEISGSESSCSQLQYLLIFLEREEFHFLYFSSCIYVRHTLKESSFLATKGLLFLIKRHSKCSKCYCWNCDESYHQGFKAFPNVDNFEKFIFCLVHCYLIPFPVKITHVMIGLGAYSYTKTPSCPLPRFAQTYLISSQMRPCLVLCFRK